MTINNLKEIDNNMLKAYLEKEGWLIQKDYPNQRLYLFVKTIDGEEFSLSIPRNEQAKDYMVRLYDIVDIMSELEDIPKEQVVFNICHSTAPLKVVAMQHIKECINNELDTESYNNRDKLINKDRMSFRIISKSTDDGTLPLDYAADVVEGLKKLVVSSIYTEKFPRRHFKSVGRQSDISHYRMGQSKVGSYIFNIDIDITESHQMEYNDDLQLDLPMSRKVIKRIQNGIASIVSATDAEEIQQLLENGYEHGLNANMCEAILAFNTQEPLELETNIEWADNIERPYNIRNKVSIKAKDFSLIEKIAKTYKENICEKVILEGTIYQLNNDNKNEEENPKRYIQMDSIIDGKNRKIKVFVSHNDYKRAYKAHGDNKRLRIKGELDKSGKSYIVYEYDNFEILE